jgi:hypothetical protein
MAALIRLNRQYRREAAALAVAGPQGGPARNITRHEVVLLVDSVDLATIAALRYARSLRPTTLRAVHFVLDDVHAEEVQEAWQTAAALRELPLHLIDCPDRRLVRAAMELAANETVDRGTHLTMLLPRRTYARLIGSLLHDHTADDIARATSRLPRVVATVVPFDVAGLIARRATSDAQAREAAAPSGSSGTAAAVAVLPPPGGTTGGTGGTAPTTPTGGTGAGDLLAGHGSGANGDAAPTGGATPIAGLHWRQRATVEGRVRSVRLAPMSGAPSVEVDLWDGSAGVTLIFYGRRAIPGVAAGVRMEVEGMVGERHGRLAICNPVYRLLEPTHTS